MLIMRRSFWNSFRRLMGLIFWMTWPSLLQEQVHFQDYKLRSSFFYFRPRWPWYYRRFFTSLGWFSSCSLVLDSNSPSCWLDYCNPLYIRLLWRTSQKLWWCRIKRPEFWLVLPINKSCHFRNNFTGSLFTLGSSARGFSLPLKPLISISFFTKLPSQ